MEKKRILVVEDDSIIAMEIQTRLEERGYIVIGPYAYGEEVIDNIADLNIDLVLMDINLKGNIDGIDTAKIIKEIYKKPIIYLTAYTDNSTIERAKVTEPFGYIIKPFEERELFTNIEMALYKHSIELKLIESEEKYRALVENSLEGVMIVDLEGSILFANPTIARLIEVPDSSNLVGNKVFEFIAPEFMQQAAEDFYNVSKGIDSYLSTYKIKTYSGKQIWIESIGKRIIYDGKQVDLISLRDITERKIAEEALQEKNREIESQSEEYMQLNEVLRITNYNLEIALDKAEESDKLKTAFLQNISHEIRTPLNGMIGFASLLQHDNITSEEIKEYSHNINISGFRLIETINNIIELSKIQTGQIIMQIEECSLDEVLLDLYSMFFDSAQTKGINLIYHKNPDGNRTIYTDEVKLNKILTNLFSNAVKFTSNGTIDFGYEIKGDLIEFYIKDTGIGIPLERQSVIFERFAQVDFTLNRNYEGSGIGLALCKGLVEFLGGKIWFESEINLGSTFYVSLPCFSSPPIDFIEFNGNLIPRSKNPTKILIVEDHWNSFNLLNNVLKYSDFSVIHAENGMRAVDIVNKYHDIDLVLMDINMPVMDGFESTKQIKKIRPELPIIAQTGYTLKEEIDRILAIGCDDYISKPINTEKLLKLIEKYRK